MSNVIPPDAFAIIIGAMKSGTSSLYRYLKEHPEICPATIKEPEFFSQGQDHGTEVERYWKLWDFDDSVHEYALEASTGYTKYPSEGGVPKNMFDYGIKPQLIYIVRNPFDRIVSHFHSMRSEGYTSLRITDRHLIDISKYYMQLEQYREYYPMKNILVVGFHELTHDTSGLLRKVHGFLGLEKAQLSDSYTVVNRTRIAGRLEQSIRQPGFRTFFSHVPESLKNFGKRVLDRISPPRDRVLSDGEKEFIYEELKQDMRDFHRVYGFDVTRWGFAI
ncbi:MAG: sulfotransferase family protein [Candidatus Brocadiia bacterium]